MKFTIRKTSYYSWSEEPFTVKGKFKIEKVPIVRIDERTCSLEKAVREFKFMDEGRNHRALNKSSCARDFDDEVWVVEIETLERLLEFYEKNGTIIIDNPWERQEKFEYGIEIYDDYRE